MPSSFQLIGRDIPESPVVLSVPHAGRDYPLSLRSALRAPFASLAALEDRHVDAIALAAREQETLLLQIAPRAWIDLNRAEHERDPLLDEGARPANLSAKVRAGLGIVPRRTAVAGELWRRRLGADEVEARIAADHRPYHDALGDTLARAQARFGTAVLLDVHSMPPIAGGRARVVLGDRFGRAAAARFVHRLEAVLEGAGVPYAINTPYAGGHILERHGRPHEHIHAIQLELDRSLYLDRRLDSPGPGMEAVTRLVRAMIDALADEASAGSGVAAQAAE
ncbi:N-formylglutamate amidohydrolase [Sphingomonas sp. Leaf412]|uniref:N-formylglutamate amidohydrolase n=1 Tax=Sphingomonas sp. Leaf412 TaxID=1736370 RepID=UPI0006FE0A4C|nr:N-formylglutamate amidohydrolase [Sphingomonas sp. Leaf412]KQT34642.1 N-formylglutamate amidohydrolase [Sphingomonas sp. Leaf412]